MPSFNFQTETSSFFHTMRSNALRKKMIEGQLIPYHVTCPALLKVFHDVPRENFIPTSLHPLAYSDAFLKISHQHYMMPPFLLGKMLQALNPQESSSTLVIGDITGYTAALLSALSGGVVSLIPDTLSQEHTQHIKNTLELHAPNPVILKQGPLTKGAPSHAPYTHLFFEGPIESLPKLLLDGLHIAGSAIALLWETSLLSKAVIYEKDLHHTRETYLFDAMFPPFPEFYARDSFCF